MADDQGPMTPIPTKTVLELTSTVSNLGGKVEEGFEGIKERLTSLESKPPHACQHPEEIAQAREVPVLKTEMKGVVGWKNKVVASVITIAILVVGGGFALYRWVGSTETQVEHNTDQIGENGKAIRAIDEQLDDVEHSIIKEVKNQGAAVRTAVKTNGDDEHIRISPVKVHKALRPYERRQLESLLDKVNRTEIDTR